MSCLSPEDVARYIASTVSAVELGAFEVHVDGCEQCRTTIAATLRAARTAAPPELGVGSQIGRYVVRAVRGTGAMGHVFEADDPDLQRTIAIKIVRHHGEAADARALREARALARIAHPNIVAVHDVGVWEGGVFLAMELVDGTTVREWIATAPRAAEVVRVFAAAAHGLAAAHAMGIIHRDIKPENLIIGDDGRVRIVDFGLAMVATEGDGRAAGTPAYMAPEQRTGEADASTDQYALVASLYEALEGHRGAVPPVFARTPRWLRPVIARGLDPDRTRRHRDVATLARLLEPRRERVGTAIAAGAVVAAALAATLHSAPSDACAIDGLGYDATAIHALGQPIAALALAKLDAWHTRAAALAEDACHSEAREVAERRRACVARTAQNVHVVLTALERPIPALAAGVLDAIDRATDVSACSAPAAALAQRDPIAEAAGRVQLAVLATRDAAGDWLGVEAGGTELAARAARDHLGSLEAEAWLAVGRARVGAHRMPGARDAYGKALVAAEPAGDELLRARIYLALVGANLDDSHRAEGERWLAQGHALLDKLGDTSQLWRVLMLEAALLRPQDATQAVGKLVAALAVYRRSAPLDDQNTLALMRELGDAYATAGDLPNAVATLSRAVELGDRVLGKNHPDLIRPLYLLADALAKQGKPELAIERENRAIAIGDATGADIGVAATQLAITLAGTGDYQRALDILNRAAPVIQRVEGELSPLLGNVLMLRGMMSFQLQRHADVERDMLRVLAIQRTYMAPEALSLVDTFEWLGRSQRALGKYMDAIRSFEDAQVIVDRQPEHKPTDDVSIETELGGSLVDSHRVAEAIPHLERALVLAKQTADREAVAFAELELAKAIAPRDRARTGALCRDALAIYAALDAAERERLSGWKTEVTNLLASLK